MMHVLFCSVLLCAALHWCLTEKFSMVLGHSEGKSLMWMSPREVRNTASLRDDARGGGEGRGERVRKWRRGQGRKYRCCSWLLRHAEQSRAEQSRAKQSKAEQSRAEQSRAEQ